MSNIEWTDETLNPIRATPHIVAAGMEDGWHCERVSPGCQNCYAETLNEAQRWNRGTGLPYNRKSRDMVDVYLDEATLLKPLRWRKPRRIFVCSMTDLFGEWVPDEMIDRIFAVMALTPQHTYQVLTKRPERMRAYLTRSDLDESIGWTAYEVWEASGLRANGNTASALINRGAACSLRDKSERWPLPNVWLGTSVEDQIRADERYDPMVALAEAGWFTWVSNEPALGPVDWSGWGFLRWMVTGGESGTGARPFNTAWARQARDWCVGAGVPWFLKQVGSCSYALTNPDGSMNPSHVRRETILGLRRNGDLTRLRSPHGSDIDEFPEDLRVREMPS